MCLRNIWMVPKWLFDKLFTMGAMQWLVRICILILTFGFQPSTKDLCQQRQAIFLHLIAQWMFLKLNRFKSIRPNLKGCFFSESAIHFSNLQNTVFPHIVSALEYFPPLNSFRTFMYCNLWPYVQLSWNYYYFVQNLYFDNKMKNLWTV